MTKSQWTLKCQIFIFLVAEILLSDATSGGGTSSKPGIKQSALKKSLLKKWSVLKAASTGLMAEESLPQQYFASPFIQNLISSNENVNSIGSGWYGFQHFVPRQSRILNERNNREESMYILGEKRPPTTTSPSSFVVMEKEHDSTEPQQQEYQYVQYENSVPEEKEGNSENTLPLMNTEILRSRVPVTLRIIPLKMTSHEISQALQKMHWLPLPMSLSAQFGNEGREEEVHGQPVYEMHHEIRDETEEDTPMYHDRSFSMPSYPPPSSHVATPLENPPAITYDRGMSFESYDGTTYHPRTFSKA